ncbi:DUF7408 domain-containing protein [Paenibacillus aceti]|uniref:DUF7408 domain-containing protein n=1 Tax=Paenibacillus aceti TaxID=1820010 RepID=UPI000EA06501|nr:hypothetical protein [Paenibacillus aceti]
MYISFKRGMHTLILSMFIVVSILWGSPMTAHAANPNISIESEIGYGGSYKHNKWTPLTITLKSDEDISGEVVVQMENPNFGGRQSYVKKVDLPAGTAKQITFGIVGNYFDKNSNSIRFYKGSVESGKHIAFKSGQAYVESQPTNGVFIGQLASDPDSLNFMNLLNNQNDPLQVLPLSGEQIPDEGIMLSSVDVLFLNNFASDTLKEQTKQAISAWVHQGGILVLSGGPSYPKTAKGLEALSPVEYKGTTDARALPEMEKLAGKALKLEHAISLSTAQLKDGADSLVRYEDGPLVASWSLGKGKVFYAAYDLATEPVHSWSGHADFWNNLLKGKLASTIKDRNRSYPDIESYMDNYLNYFPSLALPPFSLFFWSLIGYAVLVAPVLYYVLKRFDRREWAWFLIPIIAILVSGSIYVTGTSGKTSLQAHTLNMVELDGKGQGMKTTGSAIFVPRGGNYELELPGEVHLMSKREDGYISGGGEEGINRQLIRQQDGVTTLKLKDMTHRSMAKIWIAKQTGDYGALEIEVHPDQNGIAQGSVTNRLDRDLSDAALILGGNVYSLGELKQDQTVQIPAKYVPSASNNYSTTLFPYSSRDEKNRERAMIDGLLGQSLGESNNMLLAWSKDSLDGYQVNGKNPDTEQLNLWVQPVKVQFKPDQTNEIIVPYGYIPAQVAAISTSNWDLENGGERIHMEQGEVQFEFTLPMAGQIDYSSLKLQQNDPGQHTKTMIWNFKETKWEEISWNKGEVTISDHLADYIQNGALVRVAVTTEEWGGFDIPRISVKGKVSP